MPCIDFLVIQGLLEMGLGLFSLLLDTELLALYLCLIDPFEDLTRAVDLFPPNGYMQVCTNFAYNSRGFTCIDSRLRIPVLENVYIFREKIYLGGI